MAMTKGSFEGTFVFGLNNVICICAYCGYHTTENAQIEFNFREKKIFFLCGNEKCKKMNILDLSEQKNMPYPKTKRL